MQDRIAAISFVRLATSCSTASRDQGKTEKAVWRIVTETKDTEHADAADDIARIIASEMRSAGLN